MKLIKVVAGIIAAPAIAVAGWQDTLKNLNSLGAQTNNSGSLSASDIGLGLKEALTVGTGRVVALLGVEDGFNSNPEIHIPLPKSLSKAHKMLKSVGMSASTDDVELRLNRAAEAAVPKAKRLFIDAISAMTLEDVTRIYNGPPDAATRYFQSKMSVPLANEMRPVISKTMEEAGALRAYDAMMGHYREIPFVPDVTADLTEHVIQKAMDGLFMYLGREEAAIRQNPAKRTTDLLRKVFGKT